MSCRCAACLSSQAHAASRLSGAMCAPLIPLQGLPSTPADLYDHVFEIARDHFAKLLENRGESIGEAVRFTDAFAATYGLHSGKPSSSQPTATPSPKAKATTETPQRRGRAPTPTPTRQQESTPSALRTGARERSNSRVSFAEDPTEIYEIQSSSDEDWVMTSPDRPRLPTPSGDPTVHAPTAAAASAAEHPQAPPRTTTTTTTSTTTTVMTVLNPDIVSGQQQNRWMHLVAVMRWRRRWSIQGKARQYSLKGMPKNLDGKATGFGSHIGRWQWREIRHFW